MAQKDESNKRSKAFDMAYHGLISPLKALINQDPKLKDKTDEVNLYFDFYKSVINLIINF